jgi:hypothetical protein
MSWVITGSEKTPVDPQFTSVSLLLHGNGANGSTTITDNSPSPKTVTAVGNAQISTAQSKFGGASIAFDGTGDYLTLPSESAFQFGTGNFTVEMWMYRAPVSNVGYLIDARNSSQTTNWAIYKDSGTNGITWFNGSVTLVDPTPIAANTWTHIAFARQGTSLRYYINGVAYNIYTDTTNYSVSPTISYIGSRFNGADQLNANIDDLRITKGVARYTANFTPPTAPFPDI